MKRKVFLTVDGVQFSLSDVDNCVSVCMSGDNFYTKAYFSLNTDDVMEFLRDGGWDGNIENETAIEYMYLAAKHWKEIQNEYVKQKAKLKAQRNPDCFYISDNVAFYHVDTEEDELDVPSFGFLESCKVYVKAVDLADKGNAAYFYTTPYKRLTYFKTSKNMGETSGLEVECASNRVKIWQALEVYAEKNDIRIP